MNENIPVSLKGTTGRLRTLEGPYFPLGALAGSCGLLPPFAGPSKLLGRLIIASLPEEEDE